MENKITVVAESAEPKILVVTPLLPGHSVSNETKKTMEKNDISITWIASEGNNNIPKNAKLGIEWYVKNYYHMPEYYIMIDSDIKMGKNMLDKLERILSSKPFDIAFSYASFEFKGHINAKFPAAPYNIIRLLQHNYISSNSLFRLPIVRKVGLVTDDKYKRLLDWAFLLKLFYNGFSGVPCPDASFIARSTKNDISAGSQEDYNIKRERVLQDFGVPIFKKVQQHQNTTFKVF